jgi:hypothetical protein
MAPCGISGLRLIAARWKSSTIVDFICISADRRGRRNLAGTGDRR